jgi:hypothetical protein
VFLMIRTGRDALRPFVLEDAHFTRAERLVDRIVGQRHARRPVQRTELGGEQVTAEEELIGGPVAAHPERDRSDAEDQ